MTEIVWINGDEVRQLPNGWVIPAVDEQNVEMVLAAPRDVEHALAFVSDWRQAVQAGACFGLWPDYLAGKFQRVLTFEPDRLNHSCAKRNLAPRENVMLLNCALGEVVRFCHMEHIIGNAGASYVNLDWGSVRMLPLDDFNLAACGLLQLDVEGYELQALRGAEQTIRAHRPVIMTEEKGLGEQYGTLPGDIERWLLDLDLGYVYRDAVGRDRVYAVRQR